MLVRMRDYRKRPAPVFFERSELNQLLSLYSRGVMSGEWRDYAIDHGVGLATFSIFRHSADQPAFSITKRTQDSRGKTAYVVTSGMRRLKQADNIGEALSALDHRPRLELVAS